MIESLGRWTSAAIGLVTIVAVAGTCVVSVALFSGWFTTTETISMRVQRAGLLTAAGSDVKLYGKVIGRVSSLDYDGDDAVVTMQIQPDAMSEIPADVTAAVTPTTLFGRKFIALVPPAGGANAVGAIRPGTQIDATRTSVEVNDVLSDLLDVLESVDIDKVNESLNAVSTGLQGNGEALGELIVDLNRYLTEFNGQLPALERDIPKFAETSSILADSSPALLRTLENIPTTSKTLVDKRTQLNAFLLSFTQFGNSGNDLLGRSARPLVLAADGLAPVTKVLADYSPIYPCFFTALDQNRRYLVRGLGGARPGLNAQGTILAGDPPYQYPKNLPRISADNAPSCYGSVNGRTPVPPGHVNFDDGSDAYQTFEGADLAATLFGVRR